MLAIIMLIQFLIFLFLLRTVRKLYDDGNYEKDSFDEEDRVKLPVIVYIFGFIVLMIPIIGIITSMFIIGRLIIDIISEDIYYKPGRISKFLFFKLY